MQASDLLKSVLKGRSPPPTFNHRSHVGQKTNIVDSEGPKPPVTKCLCAPTTHVGSFRCRYHRKFQNTWGNKRLPSLPAEPLPPSTPVVQGKRPQGVSRLKSVTRAAVTAEGTSTEEASEEGPWRFLKYAVGAGAVAAAVGAGAQALKHRNEGNHEEFFRNLGQDAPPSTAARGLGEGGSLAYEVRSGDTLSSIASSLGTSAEVIKVANRLSGDTIQPGEKLWVPKTHTIQKGDTLSKIAREHNTSMDAILRVNSVAKPDLIFPGDILLMP